MNVSSIKEQFTQRLVKAKDIFTIERIDKKIAYEFVRRYHYLKDARFFSQYAYGLFLKRSHELIGVATFSPPQGIVALKGWFNVQNTDTSVMELSRLAMLPDWNGTNATSYLLSHAMRQLKAFGVRAVITLADSTRHVGSIYQVCNFKYYGLTDAKTDFYAADGRKNIRGAVKDVRGVWLPRNRKHRYAYLLDPALRPLYPEQPRPKVTETTMTSCCHNTLTVTDNRFGDHYTCPVCTGKLKQLTDSQWLDMLLKGA